MDSRTTIVESQRKAERGANCSPLLYTPSQECLRELPAIASRNPSTATTRQCEQLVEALMAFPNGITARDATHLMDFADVRARVRDLRGLGYQIESKVVRQMGAFGLDHRTVLYILRSTPKEVANGPA